MTGLLPSLVNAQLAVGRLNLEGEGQRGRQYGILSSYCEGLGPLSFWMMLNLRALYSW